jgi:dTDP-3-amino-2,3,6-trideoxy-4-keto-D-glucose/dTDP-3-amino-3,4,6-trideoxy-alpha-D-glucose/dTDP-2,6-dideoxy-D-kanosamine transaminase
MKVPYNYLFDQFADPEPFIAEWRKLIASAEFTLGPFVEAFERKFAAYVGVKHCISVNNGTDALILALRSLGISAGDEVVTVANTFYATVGAIAAVGARPVFVDCDDRFQIDPEKIEGVITEQTRAIIPVHWGGCSPDIGRVVAIARKHGLAVVEDACPAVGAYVEGRHAGSFGDVNAFSMHPLKPLNVMGDGGMTVTNDDKLAEWMRKYRNHGMVDRDHIEFWGVNMRLQPFQAIVGSRVLDTVKDLVAARGRNAAQLDAGLKKLPAVHLPFRPKGNVEAYQLYLARFARRDELLAHLIANGIEAKVHYPVPLHLQQAASDLGCTEGDFPKTERDAKELITLPNHQFVSSDQIQFVIDTITEFYAT